MFLITNDIDLRVWSGYETKLDQTTVQTEIFNIQHHATRHPWDVDICQPHRHGAC